MSSPFFGLDIGVSALLASQQMLNTAAHNVANANTPGFSRQRVSLVASAPYTYPGFNRWGMPGQLGTGVTVAMVSRVRDAFLDMQIQGQTALQGEWDTRQQELAKIETILNEPSDSGLGSTIGKFWNAWHDVAADPTSTAARSALLEQASTMAAEINRDAKQLKTLADGIDFQVSQQVTQINDLASQLANLNGQIQRVAVSGDHPNDLMDQRDKLLADLNRIVPTTTVTESDGTMTIIVGGTDLVAGVHARSLGTQLDASRHIQPIWPDGTTLAPRTGEIKALLEVRDVDLVTYRGQLDQLAQGIADAVNALHARGVDMTGAAGQPLFTYTAGNAASTLALNAVVAADPRRVAAAAGANAPGDGSIAGLIAGLRNALSFAAGTPGSNVVTGATLATNGLARVRAISAGTAAPQTYALSGSGSNLTLTGADGSTQTIAVADMAAGASQDLSFDKLGVTITLSTDMAAGKTGADIVGDLAAGPANTLVVASVFSPPQTASDFYAGLVGRIGAASEQASEMAANQKLVIDHLTLRQDQVSGVSLDEEATDMIRFQHAYQAAARVITTMDEMLDTLINGTGRVGR